MLLLKKERNLVLRVSRGVIIKLLTIAFDLISKVYLFCLVLFSDIVLIQDDLLLVLACLLEFSNLLVTIL